MKIFTSLKKHRNGALDFDRTVRAANTVLKFADDLEKMETKCLVEHCLLLVFYALP